MTHTPRLFLLPLTLILLTLTLTLSLAVHVNAQATTTPLLFDKRDTDIPDQFKGDLWRGITVSVVLEYQVDYELTGDDEIKDGEAKLVLPDGSELRAWVGLGNDNVILVLYKNGQKAREWELDRQDCGWTGCGGAQGTVNVEFSVACDGQVTMSAMGYTVSAGVLPEGKVAKLYTDNHGYVTDKDDAGCAQPPPGADDPDTEPAKNPELRKWVAYSLIGLGAVGAGFYLLRGGRK